MKRKSAVSFRVLAGVTLCLLSLGADGAADQPWMNSRLSADRRASLLVEHMTEAQMLDLVRGRLGIPYSPILPPKYQINKGYRDVVGSSGYVPGIASLGIPSLQETDASIGVVNFLGLMRGGKLSTALPSGACLAATFDPRIAYDGGAMVGQEAWREGLNVLLGPGVNLVRDPRNGRNFEYLGEDPLLAGTLAGQYIRGVQDQHVVATLKHYVINDQETHRHSADARIGERALRESDLLAFELAIESGHPGAVMCSYNLVNGTHACENKHLLTDVLKRDWHYPGWVMSDWGAVHSVGSAQAGLDQESAAEADKDAYFGKPLADALRDGSVPESRLKDMAHRILRSLIAVGLLEHPGTQSKIDYDADGRVALREAEDGIVLLKNDGSLLPLTQGATRIAVIGGHADAGVLSGGGSAQVYPAGPGGAQHAFLGAQPYTKVPVEGGTNFETAGLGTMIFDPSPPLDAIRAGAPKAEVRFDSGRYPRAAARLAKWAEVVIVFGTQWTHEGEDVPDLSLPSGQDALIDAIAAANPNTVVVLETGGPVVMPWLAKVKGVIEAWYPGQRGGEAIANVLFGKVNPSGRLPMTFPQSIEQNSRLQVPGLDLPQGTRFDVDYTEGSDVGYRWFAARKMTPLFPFGYGLSYTTFSYSGLKVGGGRRMTVSFDVTNGGARAGEAVPQVYLTSRNGQSLERLIGFSKVMLQPGQTRHVSLAVDPRLLADFDATRDRWSIPRGMYTVMLGSSATDRVLASSAKLDRQTLRP